MATAPAPARGLIPATASIAATAVLAAVIALRGTGIAGLLAVPGSAAVLAAGVGVMLRRPAAIVACVLLVALEYGVAILRHGGSPDPAAPLVGAALLVVAELALVAVEWHEPHAVVLDVEIRRWLLVTAAATAGVMVGAIALVLAQSTGSLGFAALVAGAAAVVAIVALMTWVTRRARRGG
jgi:hypothetical protein